MVLFQTMRDNGNKYFTIDELVDLVNNNPNKKNKVTRHAVYDIIHRYSKHYEDAKKRRKGYLLLIKDVPRKKGQMGRTKKKYKLSKRLLDRVGKYEKRWEMGLPINFRERTKLRMTVEYTKRSRAISYKIRTDEYDKYEYLLV
ncbi:hypothetical protein J7W08_07875 [Methanococcoides orientis]|uniref:hypothetical protein n=1 Tax=Methanococcoides orientis TaxID=2822137 RepID=UPI001E5A9B3C|nr:hypothetical protein [Methanococcoides orientis]UGV40030.1 hypothetical protein J7W08_07875 [Methanococcoides orientis]